MHISVAIPWKGGLKQILICMGTLWEIWWRIFPMRVVKWGGVVSLEPSPWRIQGTFLREMSAPPLFLLLVATSCLTATAIRCIKPNVMSKLCPKALQSATDLCRKCLLISVRTRPATIHFSTIWYVSRYRCHDTIHDTICHITTKRLMSCSWAQKSVQPTSLVEARMHLLCPPSRI